MIETYICLKKKTIHQILHLNNYRNEFNIPLFLEFQTNFLLLIHPRKVKKLVESVF
jgi:hypothetical protein